MLSISLGTYWLSVLLLWSVCSLHMAIFVLFWEGLNVLTYSYILNIPPLSEQWLAIFPPFCRETFHGWLFLLLCRDFSAQYDLIRWFLVLFPVQPGLCSEHHVSGAGLTALFSNLTSDWPTGRTRDFVIPTENASTQQDLRWAPRCRPKLLGLLALGLTSPSSSLMPQLQGVGPAGPDSYSYPPRSPVLPPGGSNPARRRSSQRCLWAACLPAKGPSEEWIKLHGLQSGYILVGS